MINKIIGIFVCLFVGNRVLDDMTKNSKFNLLNMGDMFFPWRWFKK